jgi:RNA polymerase sigma-70 factor (ECF subfamily)
MNRFDAQDLLSDTIEASYKSFSKIKDEKAFLSFLFTIANRLKSKYSKKYRRENELTESLEKLFEDDSVAERSTEFRLLIDRIKLLSDKERQCLLLFEMENYSRREVSLIMDLKEGTVKSILYRTKNKLRANMEINK